MKEMNERAMQAVLKNLWTLDDVLWRKFFPDWSGKATASFDDAGRGSLYLQADLEAILMKHPAEEVQKALKETLEGMEFSEETGRFVEFEKARRATSVRKDFEGSLKAARSGRDLSGLIGWGLSRSDLEVLAGLHERGCCREKIEDLLEDCNFHAECSDFSSGRYYKYLRRPRD